MLYPQMLYPHQSIKNVCEEFFSEMRMSSLISTIFGEGWPQEEEYWRSGLYFGAGLARASPAVLTDPIAATL